MPVAGLGGPPTILSNVAALAGGTAASGSSGSVSRDDHVHPAVSAPAFVVGTPTSRTVAFATAYQATDPTKTALVALNLTSTANLSLTGGTTNSVDIVIGATNAVASGTGTVIGKYSNASTGTLTIGLNTNAVAATPCSFVLPVGWFFAARVTAGAATITSAFDQSLA